MALLALGRNRRSDILVGAFVLTGLVLVGGWATVKIAGPSLRGHEYLVHLTDVTGLKVGTPVLVSGYRVGLVRRIVHHWSAGPRATDPSPRESKDCARTMPPESTLTGRPSFQLSLVVDRDWPITTESHAQIESPVHDHLHWKPHLLEPARNLLGR
jgi:hypothetical protein